MSLQRYLLRSVFLVSALLPMTIARGDIVYGVTNNNFLVSWGEATPTTLNSGMAITGLMLNEQIVGLDYRPRTGQFFAVGSSNRAYILDQATGQATPVGAGFNIGLNGSQFAYDFNPTIDRSRLVSDTRSNYVINPLNGSIGQFTDVFYANSDVNFGISPNITHAAYSNNVDGAMTSQLFSIDSALNILARQANSLGTLNTVGSLGIDINGVGGFDISGSTGRALGAWMLNGSSQSDFFEIDLMTGQASFIGQIGAGNVITAMTIMPVPEPSSALLGLAGMGILTLVRRRNTP